jgi:hypothetical protein
VPTLFSLEYNGLFAKADRLKQCMDNILPEQAKLRQDARNVLHNFLERHPEMGPRRYQKYLGQDGPDIPPQPFSRP